MKSVVLPTLSLLLISMFPFGSGEILSLSFSLTPYVMFVNSATETIRFETNVNANFTIDYGTTASYGHIVSSGTLDIMHEINITGLLPNTLYYYNVTIKSPDGQTSSYDSTFTTAVDGGTSASNFVFAVLGDSRADSGDGVDTNEFPTLINHAVNNYNPRFIIMTGDVVTTSGNDYNTIKQAWKTYTDQVVSISDHIPIFNALGNHEHVTASTPNALLRYQEIWMHPHNGDGESGYYDEVTFWQEFGNSLFIFISTEEPSFSPRIQSNQLTWLNNTVRKRGYTHKFVFFHRPICGTTRSGTVSGSYPADSAMLDQMFSDNNVTIAFAGHNHYYCYNTTASGMTYVITGGAGAPLYPTTNGLGTVKYSEYHYVVVNVTDVTVNATMVNMTGSVRHSFQEYGVTQKQTIFVPDDYPTIQEAINAADSGDTIFVYNGTYYENVVINKTVSLIGENPINTIIDGGKTGSVVYVRAINSSISGFTIQNSGTSNRASGVRVSQSSGNNISLNVITNNDCGIFIYGSSKNTMSNNIINANRIYGIHLWSSSNNTLTNNTISNNYNGIIKEGSSNNILKNNTAFGNLYNFGVGGWELSHFVHDIDTSNKVDGKSIQYLVNKKDIVIDSSWDVGYLCLVNSTNMTIKDLALTIRNWHGIKLAYTKNSRIENVTISRTSYAIDFSRSSNNIIINTNILNRNGIRLSASNDNTIINNSISSTWDAFYFHFSNNNTITGNHINNNEHGILFYSSSRNIIENNYINNNRYGISLHPSRYDKIYPSSNNVIVNNYINNNMHGIELVASSSNKIYHNNFINNSNQAHSHNLTNIWDNGCEGNYWSDYNGTDLDGNGIGDTPYVIDVNNTDNYPLMKPYWDLADIDHDLDVDIFDIVIAAGAYGSTPSDPHWNPHCDIAEPYGIIDIYDIVMIAGSYGEEYNP